MKKLSKYETEMHENTGTLHSIIMNENNKYGYKDKLIRLYNSYTFSNKDLQAVIMNIAFAHGLDITRIDTDYIINTIGKIA